MAGSTASGGDQERPVLEEEPQRAGGKFLGPGAATRHRPLARGGATMGNAELAGKEKGAREVVQHQEMEGNFASMGDNQKGVTFGESCGAIVLTPAWYACAVRGKCG